MKHNISIPVTQKGCIAEARGKYVEICIERAVSESGAYN